MRLWFRTKIIAIGHPAGTLVSSELHINSYRHAEKGEFLIFVEFPDKHGVWIEVKNLDRIDNSQMCKALYE